MKYSYLILLLFVTALQLFAQISGTTINYSGLLSETFTLTIADTVFQLSKEFINENSEELFIDSLYRLKKDIDYKIDYRYGKIFISRNYLDKLFSDSAKHFIAIKYRALPINFKNEYSLRKIEIRRDSAGEKKSVISETRTPLFSDDFFGPGLQKSGSIVRGFSVGSNRDLTLNSGFRMQLAGKLAQDVDVTAALTDENSPIQPEGTTQTLREVDKVFVEIRHPNYSATLGDFNLQIDRNEGGEFGRLNRKLQGARGIASFEQIGGSDFNGAFSITGATARGKYHTNQFQGIENMQGPYRLTGKNGETRLIVIAGSERVYLNGELMTRGETNDYIIDYSSGEVTFSSRRLITNASRITIDFEYTDQQFVRNLVGGSVQASADFFKTNISFFQEADDPDSPIDITLDDSTRAILRRSGTDRMKASLSGIVKVDSGKGLYLLKDTILSNGRNYSILIYAPGDPQANYLAQFSQVDRVPSDSVGYIRIGAGQFKFAGLGFGNYLPLQFLPMPQRHQAFDINNELKLGRDFTFYGEYAGSRFERNRFATQDSNVLNGGAFTLEARYNPKKIEIGRINFGEVDLKLTERYVDKKFLSLDRTNEVEFNRKWDIIETTYTDEEIQEISIGYKPTNTINGLASYGLLNRPGEVRSNRTQFDIGISDSNLPATNYRLEKINSSNKILKSESEWLRQLGIAEYQFANWKSALRIETEERLAKPVGLDSLQSGSFRYIEVAPKLITPEYLKMTASAEFQIRTEDSAYVGSLKTASRSVTQIYNWQLNDYQLIISSLTLSLRNVKFTDDFKLRGNLNSDAVLVRSQTRYTPLKRAVETDVYYEFSNQRSARLERIFIKVMKGSGNYKFVGDRNQNGIADDGDFELTRFDGDYISIYLPSEQLYPVADLKSSIRLRLQPVRIISMERNWMNNVLRAISTETYIRIDEKSNESDAKQIYLLNFRRFLNEKTTLSGSQLFTQDLFLFENNPDLSFRFRYSQRNGLTQFVSAVERSYIKERSVRVRSQLVREIANQTDFINKQDRVKSSITSFRDRDLISNALFSDFSYRPFTEWEVGFNFGFTEVENYFSIKKETANINEQGIRVIKSFPGTGQLRAEFKREEVVLKNIVNLIYELTSGKSAGQSFLWQLNFDYRISANLQLSLNYNGRSEGSREPIHYARMEARAFF